MAIWKKNDLQQSFFQLHERRRNSAPEEVKKLIDDLHDELMSDEEPVEMTNDQGIKYKVYHVYTMAHERTDEVNEAIRQCDLNMRATNSYHRIQMGPCKRQPTFRSDNKYLRKPLAQLENF